MVSVTVKELHQELGRLVATGAGDRLVLVMGADTIHVEATGVTVHSTRWPREQPPHGIVPVVTIHG